MQLSETFWVGFYTSCMACLLGIGRMCYKSKCKEVKICCVKIVRDIQAEEELDMKVDSPKNNSETL
jgi:hypothetical protein